MRLGVLRSPVLRVIYAKHWLIFDYIFPISDAQMLNLHHLVSHIAMDRSKGGIPKKMWERLLSALGVKLTKINGLEPEDTSLTTVMYVLTKFKNHTTSFQMTARVATLKRDITQWRIGLRQDAEFWWYFGSQESNMRNHKGRSESVASPKSLGKTGVWCSMIARSITAMANIGDEPLW